MRLQRIHPFAQHAHLLLTTTKIMPTIRRYGVALVSLAHPNKAPTPPN